MGVSLLKPWCVLTAALTASLLSLQCPAAGAASLVPADVPVEVGYLVAFKDVSDKTYLDMLAAEQVGGGKTLLQTTQNVSWPDEPDFSNSALWAFGAASMDNLYVWSVGTDAMCLQYAATLSAIANEGFYVICPTISKGFTIPEWVLKAVLAVEWAFKQKSFGKVFLGGHSGGGPAALAAGYALVQRGSAVAAGFALQHPGIVPFMNVPGCAANAKDSSQKTDCSTYFPEGMLGKLTGPILITCGSFCEKGGAADSNFLNLYGKEESFLQNSSDCMVSTLCEDAFGTFITPASGGGLQYKHCGEHEYSVMGPYGLKQEGEPAVVPFLRALRMGQSHAVPSIVQQSGTMKTCYERHGGKGDEGLKLVSPSSPTMKYMQEIGANIPWVNVTDQINVEPAYGVEPNVPVIHRFLM